MTPTGLTADEIDADPLALLPASPIAVVSVEARSLYASGSAGAQLASLSEQLVPLGDEAGFRASRDVDRVVAGSYAAGGTDVAAVVTGRFDEAKIRQAADAHAQTQGPGALVKSTYAKRDVYAIGDAAFTILTPKTALAGTQSGLRRALDRIRDGHPKRELPAWAEQTMGTPNAVATLSADLNEPVAAAAIATLPGSGWAKGAGKIAATATLDPAGAHVAARVTYADAASAESGARSLRRMGAMANLVALTGITPRLEGFDVRTAGADVQCSFAVDDRALQMLLSQLAKHAH